MKDLPLNEIILRKYEKPYKLEKRELIKKICLSLGLLQSGDSRDIIVDILMVLIEASKEKKHLSSSEIKNNVGKSRKKYSLETKGLADSNIRRQLKRLCDSMLIEKKQNQYRISEFNSLKNIFQERIENFIIPGTIERIKEYMDEIEKI